MPVITFIDGDDWIGIYSDDYLVFEDHSIRPDELLKLFNRQEINYFGRFEACLDWLDAESRFPRNLKDVHISYLGESLPFYDYLEKRQQ